MLKISTEIASAARIVGENKAIELIGKAGFDAWDFSLFDIARWDWRRNAIIESSHPLRGSGYLTFAKELKRIGEEYGMVCNQSHAPFPTSMMSVDFIKKAIECTAEVGGKICVVHPDNDGTVEKNRDYYLSLLTFAKEYGVKLATENMWNWDDEKNHSSFAACATADSFVRHIDAVNDPFLVACLDIGHAEMFGSGDGAANMIRALGYRLQAIHLHDNNKINDSHQIPFSMNIDFSEVAKALREIGYQGYVTLEADCYLKDYDSSNIFSGIKKLEASARKFAELIG